MPEFTDKIALSIDEAAQCLSLSRVSLINNLLPRPDFPSFKVGSRVLIPKQQLIEWCAAQCREKNSSGQ